MRRIPGNGIFEGVFNCVFCNDLYDTETGTRIVDFFFQHEKEEEEEDSLPVN
jgi:hypothetical protein